MLDANKTDKTNEQNMQKKIDWQLLRIELRAPDIRCQCPDQ